MEHIQNTPFSFLSLLDIIGNTECNKVEIRVFKKTDFYLQGWLGSMFESKVMTPIIEKYREKKFQMELRKVEDTGWFSDSGVIQISLKIYRN